MCMFQYRAGLLSHTITINAVRFSKMCHVKQNYTLQVLWVTDTDTELDHIRERTGRTFLEH